MGHGIAHDMNQGLIQAADDGAIDGSFPALDAEFNGLSTLVGQIAQESAETTKERGNGREPQAQKFMAHLAGRATEIRPVLVHEGDIARLELASCKTAVQTRKFGLTDDGFPGQLQQFVDVMISDACGPPPALGIARGGRNAPRRLLRHRVFGGSGGRLRQPGCLACLTRAHHEPGSFT